MVREGNADTRVADIFEVHASAPPNEGATLTGGDDNAPVESLVVVTVGDTLAGGEVVVGDTVTATGRDDKALGDDNAPVESLAVATVGDTLAGKEVVVGDVVAATGGDD